MVDLNPSLKDMNLASIVLRATSICNFDIHFIGHPAKMITKLILDLAVDESRCAVFSDQFSPESTLHHKSKDYGLGL